MTHRRLRWWQYSVGAIVAAVLAVALLWRWDWFTPLVERFASAQLGRPVTVQHLHVQLAENPRLELDGISIANPPDFPAPGPFASIARLTLTLNAAAYLHRRAIVVPALEIDQPVVNARALADGRNNWSFPFTGPPADGGGGAGVRIGDLRIVDGHAHVVDPAFKADFNLAIATAEKTAEHPSQLIVSTTGRYANQPISGHFIGGALLSLRDKSNPYPVDLTVENGPTKITLKGSVADPLAFAGSDLKVALSGQDMANLTALIGVPAPTTPPFHFAGTVTYADGRLHIDDLAGAVGATDLSGSLAMDLAPQRPVIDINLRSRSVDLGDFLGVLGRSPTGAATPGATPQQRAAVQRENASPYLIPRAPLDLPRLRAADVTLRFHGGQIAGRFVPLDDVVAEVTVKGGAIHAHPLSFGVGRGRISADITAAPADGQRIHARSEVDFRQIDLARLMSATHSFGGAGIIGGHATVDGTGASIGDILGGGNGELKLFMTGGDLSALLVDLSGLEFGRALMSALGVPDKTEVRCLVADFMLADGLLSTRTMLLDTQEANVTGSGDINLRDETIAYQLRTEAKHFSIGSLPAPIDISGHLRTPHIAPDAKVMALRGGVAIGLGVLLTPLAALLPTIQLGLGENNNCAVLIGNARATHNPADGPGSATADTPPWQRKATPPAAPPVAQP